MNDRLKQGQLPASEMGQHWDAEIGSVKVVFGEGRHSETASQIRRLGCHRILVVSDPGIEAAGHLTSLRRALDDAGLRFIVFAEVEENPTTEHVEHGRQCARRLEPDCVVALGGGSTMDCAKGINFLLTNDGEMSDYWGFGKAEHPLLPAVGIPTTAGTGSEAQSFALISDPKTHRKMACGDPTARFRAVILDPALLSSAPGPVASAAGMDAVGHAVESFVSAKSNPISRMLALQAWRLLDQHLESSLEPGCPTGRRGPVLLGAHLAGAAIEQSMLGAAHACANPLTAEYGIAHGQAIALMLPHVVRFNSSVADNRYLELARVAGLDASAGAGAAIASRLAELALHTGLPDRLRSFAIVESDLTRLADSALLEWTASFNPRPLSKADFEAIYRAAY